MPCALHPLILQPQHLHHQLSDSHPLHSKPGRPAPHKIPEASQIRVPAMFFQVLALVVWGIESCTGKTTTQLMRAESTRNKVLPRPFPFPSNLTTMDSRSFYVHHHYHCHCFRHEGEEKRGGSSNPLPVNKAPTEKEYESDDNDDGRSDEKGQGGAGKASPRKDATVSANLEISGVTPIQRFDLGGALSV